MGIESWSCRPQRQAETPEGTRPHVGARHLQGDDRGQRRSDVGQISPQLQLRHVDVLPGQGGQTPLDVKRGRQDVPAQREIDPAPPSSAWGSSWRASGQAADRGSEIAQVDGRAEGAALAGGLACARDSDPRNHGQQIQDLVSAAIGVGPQTNRANRIAPQAPGWHAQRDGASQSRQALPLAVCVQVERQVGGWAVGQQAPEIDLARAYRQSLEHKPLDVRGGRHRQRSARGREVEMGGGLAGGPIPGDVARRGDLGLDGRGRDHQPEQRRRQASLRDVQGGPQRIRRGHPPGQAGAAVHHVQIDAQLTVQEIPAMSPAGVRHQSDRS